MKKGIVVLLGLIFFPLAFLLNAWMQSDSFPVTLLWLFGVGALALWLGCGWLSFRLLGNQRQAFLLGNSFPFLILLLVLFQEWVLGAYWPNLVGIAGQVYYLPVIKLGFSLTPMFHTVPPAYLVSFALLCAVFWLGMKLPQKSRGR